MCLHTLPNTDQTFCQPWSLETHFQMPGDGTMRSEAAANSEDGQVLPGLLNFGPQVRNRYRLEEGRHAEEGE